MSSLKRILALVMSVVMLTTLCAVNVSAEANTKTLTITTDAPADGVSIGDKFTISYSLEGGADDEIRSINFDIPYDNTKINVANVSGTHKATANVGAETISVSYMNLLGDNISVGTNTLIAKIEVTVLADALAEDIIKLVPAIVYYQVPSDAGTYSDVTVTDETDIFVKDIVEPVEYTITYDKNGGTGEMVPAVAYPGVAFELPECGFVAPDGYEFGGWEIDGVKANGTEYYFTGDTVVKALWKSTEVFEKILTVTTDAPEDGVSVGDTFTISYSLVGGPDDKVRSFNFEVPYDNEKIKVTNVGGFPVPITVSENDLKALYTDVNNIGFSIAEELVIAKIEVMVLAGAETDDIIKIVPETATYQLVDDATTYSDVTVTDETDIFVKENSEPVSYTITYDANGGAGEMAPAVAYPGVAFELPECGFTAPDGYEFDAWEIGRNKINQTEYYFVADTVVRARWKEIGLVETKTLRVTTDAPEDGVSVGDTFTVSYSLVGTTDEKIRSLNFEIPYNNEKLKVSNVDGFIAPITVGEIDLKALYIDFSNTGFGIMEERVVAKIEVMVLAGAEIDDVISLVPEVVSYQVVGDVGTYSDTIIADETDIFVKEGSAPVSYTITYDANGGTGEMISDVAYPGVAFELPECGFTAPDGKEFDGWEIDGSKVNGTEYYFVADTVVKARWKEIGLVDAKTLRVITDAPENGVSVGDTFTISYSFVGAADERVRSLNFEVPYNNEKLKVSNVDGFIAPITVGETDLKALYIDFSNTGFSVAEEQVVAKIEVMVLAGAEIDDVINLAPEIVAYQVVGDAGSYTDVVIVDETDIVVKENSEPVSYAITYDANGGTGEMVSDVAYPGVAFELPDCGFTAPDGKEFDGWEIDGSKVNGTEYYFVADTVVKARWKEIGVANTKVMTIITNAPESGVSVGDTFTVTYNLTGESGDKVRSYSFEIPYDNTKISVANVAGYPMTVSVTETMLKVLYVDLSGGLDISKATDILKIEVTVLEGSNIGESIKLVPEIAYYQAPGIAGNKSDVTITDKTDITVVERTTALTHTVTYDANGGTGEMISATVEDGAQITLPECEFAAPLYKKFAGWQIGEEVYSVGTKVTINANTVVKAIWQNITYTVTYNANGGTGLMEDATVNAGSQFTLPGCGFTAPEGKEFKGWKVGQNDYKAGNKITVLGDLEVVAQWKDKAVVGTPNEKTLKITTDAPIDGVWVGKTFTITYSLVGGAGDVIRAFNFEVPYDKTKISVKNVSGYPVPVTAASTMLKALYVDITGAGFSAEEEQVISKIEVTVLEGASIDDMLSFVPVDICYQEQGDPNLYKNVVVVDKTDIRVGEPMPESVDVEEVETNVFFDIPYGTSANSIIDYLNGVITEVDVITPAEVGSVSVTNWTAPVDYDPLKKTAQTFTADLVVDGVTVTNTRGIKAVANVTLCQVKSLDITTEIPEVLSLEEKSNGTDYTASEIESKIRAEIGSVINVKNGSVIDRYENYSVNVGSFVATDDGKEAVVTVSVSGVSENGYFDLNNAATTRVTVKIVPYVICSEITWALKNTDIDNNSIIKIEATFTNASAFGGMPVSFAAIVDGKTVFVQGFDPVPFNNTQITYAIGSLVKIFGQKIADGKDVTFKMLVGRHYVAHQYEAESGNIVLEQTMTVDTQLVYGDGNGDGIGVTFEDIDAAVNHYMERKIITDRHTFAQVDVVPDGSIDFEDINYLINYYLEVIDKFPVENED